MRSCAGPIKKIIQLCASSVFEDLSILFAAKRKSAQGSCVALCLVIIWSVILSVKNSIYIYIYIYICMHILSLFGVHAQVSYIYIYIYTHINL